MHASTSRRGYIIKDYTPSDTIVEYRGMVQFKHGFVQSVATMSKDIQRRISQMYDLPEGILESVPFSATWLEKVQEIDDFVLKSKLETIKMYSESVTKVDARIHDTVKGCKDAQLLLSIPGMCEYCALTIVAGIGDVEKFKDSGKLCSYFGVVPLAVPSKNAGNQVAATRDGINIWNLSIKKATHEHIKCAPESSITAHYRNVLERKASSVAVVAASSKMLRVIFWMLKEKRKFATNYNQDNSELAEK
ncbi:MAG: transposase [Thaumarchaeota archaeon]|nr:transposase [Nitrososphaerota archaeon]